MEMAQVTRYKTIKLVGLSLTEVQKEVASLLDNNEEVSYQVEMYDGRIHIVLKASGNTEEEAKAWIKPFSKKLKEKFGAYIYSMREEDKLETIVVKLLEKHDLTVATAESCTGGLLAARLVHVPGVSEVFKEGFVTYTNKAKRKRLNVGKSTLKKYGAVSSQTAKEMVTGLAIETGADCGISVTGIAGPDGGTKEKPVGLVYIGCILHENIVVEEHRFKGDRMEVREQSVTAALDLLRRMILEIPS